MWANHHNFVVAPLPHNPEPKNLRLSWQTYGYLGKPTAISAVLWVKVSGSSSIITSLFRKMEWHQQHLTFYKSGMASTGTIWVTSDQQVEANEPYPNNDENDES